MGSIVGEVLGDAVGFSILHINANVAEQESSVHDPFCPEIKRIH